MKIVKIAIEDVVEVQRKADGKACYVVKCLSNRGRDKDGNFLKDVALYTDKKTFDDIQSDKDVILRFVSDRTIKA